MAVLLLADVLREATVFEVMGYCSRSSSSKISSISTVCSRISGGTNISKSLRTAYWIISSSNNNNNKKKKKKRKKKKK